VEYGAIKRRFSDMAKIRSNRGSDAASTPEWVTGYASVLLKTGLRLPEVEERLVARGLTPELASKVVEELLEARIRQQVLAQKRLDRWKSLNRILSAVVAVVYIVIAYWSGGDSFAGEVTLELVLPLACIWFGVEAGRHFANTDNDPTPSVLIRLGGWLLLIIVGIFVVLRGPLPI